jgi:DNA-binding transcriptional ArsR family regulator
MTSPSDDVDVPPIRTVADVAALKAMADPTRLAILSALMKAGGTLPVMSVKELAEELGEPQTKLYRHVRQLEAAGLIRVAATRVVSGILEQRYQASQRDLMFGAGFLRSNPDDSEKATAALLDWFRAGLFTAMRGSPPAADGREGAESDQPTKLFFADSKLSRDQAAQLRAKIQEIAELVEADSDDPDAKEFHLLVGLYSPAIEQQTGPPTAG